MSEPAAPKARASTPRQAIIAALTEVPATARELSQLVGLSEKEVLDHLTHLMRSAARQGLRLVVEPARCTGCEFSFDKRDRLGKPSRCPRCKSERIVPPGFALAGTSRR